MSHDYNKILVLQVSCLRPRKNDQWAHGVEPWTSRSAVECSTTELYPQ